MRKIVVLTFVSLDGVMQRLRREVLEPLLAGRPAQWHPLDFQTDVGWVGRKDETVSLDPAPVIILDRKDSRNSTLVSLKVGCDSRDSQEVRKE